MMFYCSARYTPWHIRLEQLMIDVTGTRVHSSSVILVVPGDVLTAFARCVGIKSEQIQFFAVPQSRMPHYDPACQSSGHRQAQLLEYLLEQGLECQKEARVFQHDVLDVWKQQCVVITGKFDA